MESMIKSVIPNIEFSLPTGTDTFIVTVTLTAQTLYFNEIYTATADKTVAAIYAAYEAGKDVYASILGSYLPLVIGNGGRVEFEHIQHDADVAVRFGLQGVSDPDVSSDEWTFRTTRSSLTVGANAASYDLDGGTP